MVVALLLLMITTTHYNFSGGEWLIITAGAIVAALSRDTVRNQRSAGKPLQVPVGLSLFLIVIGLILDFAPRDDSRALALKVIAPAIAILGALGLTSRLVGARVHRRVR